MNKLIDKITVPSLIILLIIAVFYKFNGALHHSFYRQIPQYFTSPEYFTQNLFIKQSTVIYSSIYYTLLNYLNIDIYNGISSLLIHFLFSLISIFYSYKIIKILTKNQKFSYVILLCVVYSDFFILSSIRSSPVFSHTLTPSHFSHSLVFPLIYYSIKSRWLIVSILSSISIIVSIKVSWFPITITYLYYLNLFFRKKSFDLKTFKSLLWMLIPPTITLILIIQNITPDFTFYEKNKIFEFIIWRDGEEDALHLNPILRIFFLFVSFFLFSHINKHSLRGNFYFYNNILLISTIVMTIGGLIYNKFLYIYFPIPEILLLSPVRSLSLYQILFTIVLVNYSIEKRELFLNILILAYLSFVTLIYGSFNYSLYVFLILAVTSNLSRRLFGKELKSHSYMSMTILLTFFLLLTKLSFKPKNMLWVGDKNIYLNKNIDKELLDVSSLIKDNQDFPLLSISQISTDEKINLDNIFNQIDNRSNIISKKSEYFSDSAHFYLSLNYQKEYFRRLEFIKLLFAYFKNPYNFKKFEKMILCEDIVVLGPKKIFKNLGNEFERINLNENYQLLPLGVFKHYNFK